MLYQVHLARAGFELTALVVIANILMVEGKKEDIIWVLVRVVLSLQVTILAIYSSYNTCCQTNLSVRIFNYLCKTIEHHIDTIKHWQELLDHQSSCKIFHQNWLSMIISEELLLMKKFSKT